jgi:hypothetical protein
MRAARKARPTLPIIRDIGAGGHTNLNAIVN